MVSMTGLSYLLTVFNNFGWLFGFKCTIGDNIVILKYIKVHTATRWTIRHSLKLHWFADLMNVTEIVIVTFVNCNCNF